MRWPLMCRSVQQPLQKAFSSLAKMSRETDDFPRRPEDRISRQYKVYTGDCMELPHGENLLDTYAFGFDPTIDDEQFTPSEIGDEFETFRKYYEKSICTTVICDMIKNIRCFFNGKDTNKYGCILSKAGGPNKAFAKEVHHNEIPVLAEKNPNILNACNKIDFIENKCDGVYCTQDIAEGEPIIIENPLVLCSSVNCICVNNMHYECFHCNKLLNEFIVCKTCNVAIYCDENCREVSYNEYHRWECKGVKTHFFTNKNIGFLALRMLLYNVKNKFKQSKKKKNVKYRKFRSLKTNFKMFKKEQVRVILRIAIETLIYFIDQTDFFKHITEQGLLPEKSLYEKYLYIGGLMVRYICQAYIHTICFPLDDYSYITFSNGMICFNSSICLTTSLLKHSCTPNVAQVLQNNTCIVRAVRDIKKGEEICLSYIGLDQALLTHDEKTLQLRSKFITCTCEHCKQEYFKYDGGLLWKCTQCSGFLKKNIEEGEDGTEYKNGWICSNGRHKFQQRPIKSWNAIVALYNSIIDSDYTNKAEMEKFVVDYRKVYYNVTEDLLTMILELLKYYLDDVATDDFVKLGERFLRLMDNSLHKYSMIKLKFLVNIMNLILSYMRERGSPVANVYSFGQSLMERLAVLSDFYCYNKQFELLQGAYDKLDNIVLSEYHTWEGTKKKKKRGKK